MPQGPIPGKFVPWQFQRLGTPPTDGPPQGQYGSLQIQLVRQHRQRGTNFYLLRPPTVVRPFVAPQAKRALAQSRHIPAGKFRLGTPQVVRPDQIPGDGKRQLQAHLAAKPPLPRRYTSLLRPPQVVTATAAAFLAAPVKTALAQFRRPRAQTRLQPPQVVRPDTVPGDGKRTVRAFFAAKLPPGLHKTTSKLAPPAVVGAPTQPPVETTVRLALADSRFRARTINTLGAPVLVGAQVGVPTIGAPVRVTLAKQPPIGYGRYRKAGYSLAGPMEVNLQPAVTTLQVTLAKQAPRRRPTQSQVHPPQVVTPSAPPVVTTLRVTLAAKSPQRRPVRYQLRAPQAVTQVFPPVVTTLRVTLAARLQPQRRKVQYQLRTPQAVNYPPLVTSLHVTLAGPPQPQRRKVQYRVGKPTILAAGVIFLPVKTQLVATSRSRQLTYKYKSALRRPTVIGAPPAPPPVVGFDDITPVLVTEW